MKIAPRNEELVVPLKLIELRVVAFTKFAKGSAKTYVTLWILSTKTLFLTA